MTVHVACDTLFSGNRSQWTGIHHHIAFLIQDGIAKEKSRFSRTIRQKSPAVPHVVRSFTVRPPKTLSPSIIIAVPLADTFPIAYG